MSLASKENWSWPKLASATETRVLRLVELRIRRDRPYLHCSIEFTSIGDESYDAVSYTWGAENDTTEIICNEHYVQVPRNLRNALCSIWRTNPRLRIWADALSINQEDKTEKAQQVRMMGQVFAGAHTVWVWLGEGTEHTTYAWNFLRMYAQSGSDDNPQRDGETRIAPRYLTGITPPAYLLSAVKYLAQSSWFFRTWTFQEIVLARRAIICCGLLEMKWEDFSAGLLCLTSHYEELNYLPPEIYRINQSRHCLGSAPRCLSTQLGLNLRREATNPRDKVFGLLGLMRSSDYHHIRVDYRLPVNHVYAEACLACIRAEREISLLAAAGLEHRILERLARRPAEIERIRELLAGHKMELAIELERTLPSWCPNWNSPLGLGRLITRGTGSPWPPWPSSTSWLSEPLLGPATSGLLLQLRGLVVGYLSQANIDAEYYLCEVPSCEDLNSSLQSSRACYTRAQTSNHSSIKPTILLDIIDPPISVTEKPPQRFCRRYLMSYAHLVNQSYAQNGDWVAMFFGSSDLYVLRPQRSPTQESLSADLAGNDAIRFVLVQRLVVEAEFTISAHKFFEHGVGTFPPSMTPPFRTEILDFILH